ncbi:neurocan core protein-like protein [Lates japonicus]|uniref:Neurocan core protein-like protein n=1 Tax=Lates japonicus TaxID=270547 RepID=A0AAD3N7V9_LATJO|nr:neurocan core protein-like protein [Lates japonicus]
MALRRTQESSPSPAGRYTSDRVLLPAGQQRLARRAANVTRPTASSGCPQEGPSEEQQLSRISDVSKCEPAVHTVAWLCGRIEVQAPVKRQVVKLRMKVENSVDLNDPAVKAGILKKLQDRLEENGVSGVSLKWREQPDGKVFYKEGEKSSKEEQKKTEL